MSSSAAGKKPAAPSSAAKPAPTAHTPAPHHPPPKLVYRADTRNPPDVFTNGFSAPGEVDEHNDLLGHVLGGENLKKTGFISTTQTLRVAAAFIKPAHKADGKEDAIIDKRDPTIKYMKRVGWIYSINTTGLDMEYVPDYLVSHGHSKELNRFGYQQEWAVKKTIPGKNVWKAQRVDGYIWRYSDTMNMKQGVDALYPPDKNPFREDTTNSSYAFKA